MNRFVFLLLGSAVGLASIACSSDDSSNPANPSTSPEAGTDSAGDAAQNGGDAAHQDAADEPDAPATDTGAEASAGDGEAGSGVEPGSPLYDSVLVHQTTIAASGDPTDVYYPAPPDLGTGDYAFPIALMLQGAKVDKQHYASFAGEIARYGFVVVVPNHASFSVTGSGLYMETKVVAQVYEHMQTEQTGSSPVAGKLDLGTMVLLGHSYGGVVGLQAIQNQCQFPFCVGGFQRPAALAAGAFFGTNLKPPFGSIPAVSNDGLPIALVQGDADGKAAIADTQETYEKVQDPPKAFVVVHGANHYGICNTDNPSGADADGNTPSLDQQVAVATAARWSALFLRAHVLEDAAAADYIHATGDALDDNVTVASEH